MLYFDHNATHPLSPTARAAWLDAVEKYPANPSSPHRLGQRAEKALEDAREHLARILGCAAEEIVFTSGATESANMVLANFAEVLASAIEHPCVREPIRGRSREIAVDSQGRASVDDLRAQLAVKKPALVAMMAANNETGVLQPWHEAALLARECGVSFFCDAAQWIGKMPAEGLADCDFVSGCAHKFGGPVGIGFLKCPRDFPALLKGGPQENGRRAGTENLPAILALVAALIECQRADADPADQASRFALRENFEREFLAAIPEARILGTNADRLWNTVSVMMPELPDCRRRWVVLLDKLGAAVSTGSACASGKEKPSHVLTAMGIPAAEAGRVLRFSSGWNTTVADWGRLLEVVKKAVGMTAGGMTNDQ